MTDASQGPDWWRASDGMWYPPESHPAYVARRAPAPSGGAPYGAGVQTTQAPTAVGTPTLVEPRLPADAWRGSGSSSARFSSWRVIGLVALVASFIGAFLPWATTDTALAGLFMRVSVAGVDLGPGRLLCGVLAVILVLSWWQLAARSPATSIGLFVSWLAALALSVYEIADIIAVPTQGLALDVGVGLYLCGFATITGSLCSLIGVAEVWSDAGPVRPLAPGVLWVGGLVALGFVAAASFLGSRAAASPLGPIPVLAPEGPVTNGGGGPGPVGGGSTGGTGSSGNSGNVGGSGNSGGSGTTGSSGNTGLGGGLGNSGLGNSGSGIFGNSGSGGFGTDPFGNSGTGNSGPEGIGTSSPERSAGRARLILVPGP
jgi:hypothetical protein